MTSLPYILLHLSQQPHTAPQLRRHLQLAAAPAALLLCSQCALARADSEGV